MGRPSSLIDLPLDHFEDPEPLGLAKHASALAAFIKGCETPITVGIQGDWGIGKTSLLNLVEHNLKPKKRGGAEISIIRFNTWQYSQLSQEEYLTFALLSELVSSIQKLDPDASAVAEHGKRLLKTLGSVANQLVRHGTGVDLSEAAASASAGDSGVMSVMQATADYRAEFAKLVSVYLYGTPDNSQPNKNKLVIMIDDLDRVKPVRALELLEAVKNFADVPGCVFLLAVDYSVVQRGVAEKMGATEQELHGKSFFDKIIQVPFNMPVASYRIEEYVMRLLGWKKKGGKGGYKRVEDADGFFPDIGLIEPSFAKSIESLTLQTVGKNPRSIKRAVNYATLLRLVFDRNDGKSRAKDYSSSFPTTAGKKKAKLLYYQLLYAFACFELAYPEVSALFVQQPTKRQMARLEDWAYLDTTPGFRRLLARVHDEDETRSLISGFFEELRVLIDADEDGELSDAEFRPVWEVVQLARLTTASMGGGEDHWDELRRRAEECAGGSLAGDLQRLWESIRSSQWSSDPRVSLLPAGSQSMSFALEGVALGGSGRGRSRTIPLGSLATTKKSALQFHVHVRDFEAWISERPSDWKQLLTEVGDTHRGFGNVLVDSSVLGRRSVEDAARFLNDLLKTFEASSPETRPTPAAEVLMDANHS